MDIEKEAEERQGTGDATNTGIGLICADMGIVGIAPPNGMQDMLKAMNAAIDDKIAKAEDILKSLEEDKSNADGAVGVDDVEFLKSLEAIRRKTEAASALSPNEIIRNALKTVPKN